MITLEKIRAECSIKDIWEGQLLHLGLIILMVFGAHSLLMPAFSDPTFLGWDSNDWAMASILLAVVHQVMVAVVFRLQLYTGFMTKLFGANDIKVWGAIFLPLLASRPLTILAAAWLDPYRITNWRGIEVIVGAVLVILAIVTMHSVIKYFTIFRALGADHFRNEVIAMPTVKQGMFRYTNNAMYGIVFLGLWGIALLFGSWNALIVALFQHCYIWVHMHLTEGPDMRRLYSPG
ncbi:MAG: hypothetical protein GY952_20355 [Rhodobacteraceae bacterium]|nr:hypothetical protein [Paracoccaceae bacterium]